MKLIAAIAIFCLLALLAASCGEIKEQSQGNREAVWVIGIKATFISDVAYPRADNPNGIRFLYFGEDKIYYLMPSYEGLTMMIYRTSRTKY
jgi:hypothetical protein